MNTSLLLAQEATAAHLLGWWMALLMIIPFVPWAWLISAKLDKDARYFHLNHRMWNGIHVSAGIAGLAAMLLIPVVGVSWLIGVIIMGTPILVYWKYRNQKVPETQRYSLTGAAIGDRATARRAARAASDAVLNFTDARGGERPIPVKDDPRFGVHMLIEDVVGPALDARASRVEMAVGPNGCAVSQTVDGVRYKRTAVPLESAVAMVDYLKDIAGMDLEDRRRRQVGTCKVDSPNGVKEVAVTTAGSSSGHVLRLEFDRAQRLSKPFDGLGLLPSQLEALQLFDESHERHGIILVGAPSGHGLSTSVYSFLSRHDAYTANIKALEREVLLQLDGVDHVQYDPSNPDVDYATALQSILRRDPDVVMPGHVKDQEVAQVITDPGMQGPLIYVPMALGTIEEAIRDWVKIVGDVKGAAKTLRAVTNQRLVRTLCPNCRQPYTPTPEQLKKLNLSADRVKQLYRASGKVQVKNKIENCPVCGGTGFLGQSAAFQVLIVDDEIRKLLAGGDLKGAMSLARRNKMIYLQEAALAKVVAGETTIEEVIRATAPPKSKSQPQPASVPS